MVSTDPCWSTPTHSDDDGHEIPFSTARPTNGAARSTARAGCRPSDPLPKALVGENTNATARTTPKPESRLTKPPIVRLNHTEVDRFAEAGRGRLDARVSGGRT